MGAGLLTIVVVARVLGTEGFGALMIFLSAASVLCIVSNLGINTYVLREVARNPESASAVVSETLTAKLILSAVMFGLAVGLAAISHRFVDLAFALLLLALLAEGFTEFFNIGLRATGKFATETKQSFLAALVYSSCVVGAAFAGKALLLIAIAYFTSRMFIVFVAYFTLKTLVGSIQPASVKSGLVRLRETFDYSLDAVFGALFGQIDGLLLGSLLSATAVGIYQGGLRIFMSAVTGAGILTNVLLPRSSAEIAAGGGVRTAGHGQVILIFSVFGNVIGWLFALMVPLLVVPLYGPAFEPLRTLMPWFGVLFAVRMVAGGWGVLLTAQGEQRYRTVWSAMHWALIALIAFFAIPLWGSLGWLISMLIGSIFICVLYGARALRMVSLRTGAVVASAAPVLLLAYVLTR
jgi:O-antigen/teichoic acid export membrane protein